MNPKVFLEIAINKKKIGKMTFELFANKVPKTAENFRAICTGERGVSQSGHKLHYKNSYFHRVIPEFMAQGGDFTLYDGRGGESIYGGNFQDENFLLKHEGRGMLSMANAGPGTNSSQFFITFQSCDWLNGAHVVFGKMLDGEKVLSQIEEEGSSQGTPRSEIKIVDCGEIKE